MTGLARRRLDEPWGREVLLLLLAVALFYVVTLRLNRRLNERFGAAAQESIEFITRRLPRLPMADFERLGRGTLLTRVLGDGNQIASCQPEVLGATSGAVRLAFGSLFALSVSSEATAVAFGGMLLVGVVVVGQLGGLDAGFRQVAPHEARMYDLLRSQLEGGAAFKVHRPRVTAVGQAFDELSRRVRDIRTAAFTAFYARHNAAEALVYGLLGVNVFVLPLVTQISDDAVRALNMVVLWLALGTVKLVTSLPKVSSTASALARLRDLEARLADDRLEPATREVDLDGGAFAGFERLRLDGIGFEHPPREHRSGFPLGPVDVELRRGELVLVTGPNGSGKSTFARLLAGLYRPKQGSIRVDGVEVDPSTLAAYRALFGTIFVEHRVFDRPLGLSPEALARAPAVFEEMGIAHKITLVDGRLAHRALSTGQRQRLAMALVCLGDKPVLLFDEWAADQDPEFRAWYYEVLLPRLRDEGRLVVAVSHDDAWFAVADRRLRFEDGRLVEAG
ncbi:MAG: ATP-binding cassette domain-containing protein [bacterium]